MALYNYVLSTVALMLLCAFIKIRKPSSFPAVSFRILLLFFATIASVLLLTEFFILPHLEAKGLVSNLGWVEEGLAMNRNFLIKNPGDQRDDYEGWIWDSPALPVPKEKRKKVRILVMGDSFVWGSGGVTNVNSLSWRQIERELHRRGYLDVEVIAAGKSGAETHHQIRVIPDIVKEYHVDLVVWIYVTNDPNEGVIRQATYSTSSDPVSRVNNRFIEAGILPRTNFQLRLLRQKKLWKEAPPKSKGFEYSQWEMEILKGENLSRYEKTLKTVGRWQRRVKIPLFFITVPNSPNREYFRERYEPVIPLFRKAGLPFYSIIDEFARLYPHEEYRLLTWGASPSDGHPGLMSTRFHAVKAVDILEKHYSSYLGEKSVHVSTPLQVNDYLPANLKAVTMEKHKVSFLYPETSELMPWMPFDSPSVQLNFRYPVEISVLHLEGEGLKSARLFLSGESEEDLAGSAAWEDMGSKRGKRLTFHLKRYRWKECVNSLRISAKFRGKERRVTVTMDTQEERMRSGGMQ